MSLRAVEIDALAVFAREPGPQRDRLFSEIAGLVEATAARYGRALEEDALGEAWIAVAEALETFDPAVGDFRRYMIGGIALRLRTRARSERSYTSRRMGFHTSPGRRNAAPARLAAAATSYQLEQQLRAERIRGGDSRVVVNQTDLFHMENRADLPEARSALDAGAELEMLVRHAGLTARQRAVLALRLEGYEIAEVAARLGVTLRMVERDCEAYMVKLRAAADAR